MKKINRHLLLAAVLLVLTGCNERELTFDRAYPNQAIIKEMREKRQVEIKEEIKNLPNKIMTEKTKPRDLLISGKDDKNMINLNASQYCWDYNYLDCERMIPIHPYDMLNFYLARFDIQANSVMKVFADKGRINLPFPFRTEVYIYDQNRNLNLYEAIESESNTFNFTSPTKPGIYTVLFKVFYQWDIDGIAFHVVQLYVE